MAEDHETEMEEYMSDQQGEGESSGDDAEDSQGSREGSEDESDDQQEETDNPDDPKEQVADESRRIKRRRQTASSSATPKKKGRPESHAGSTAARAGTASTSQVPAVAPAPTAAQSIAQEEESSDRGGKKKKGDCFKFNAARKLNDKIQEIRKQVEEDLQNKNTNEKKFQCAVATYLIDRLLIRVGNEKHEEKHERETVGCCTLRVKHVQLKHNQYGPAIELAFIGKCNIPFTHYIQVLNATDRIVFDYLRSIKDNKGDEDAVFDNLNPRVLTRYLDKIMKGLTAKVFRTCHASRKMEETLKQQTKEGMTENEKVAAFNEAKKSVAYYCNHIRTDAKGDEAAYTVNTLKFYIDPRIVVCWCEKWEVPIEKVYSQEYQKMFSWAINAPDYKFQF